MTRAAQVEPHLDELLAAQWRRDGGKGASRTVREWWLEACRQAVERGELEPTFEETADFFAWFFGVPA